MYKKSKSANNNTGDSMKKCIEGMILGGMAVYVYTKYKDGSVKRMITNMMPKMKCMINDMKEIM